MDFFLISLALLARGDAGRTLRDTAAGAPMTVKREVGSSWLHAEILRGASLQSKLSKRGHYTPSPNPPGRVR